MLVLSRKVGEQVRIGPSITLTVIEINGNRIKLGIQAPEEVRIFRAELNAYLGQVGTGPKAPDAPAACPAAAPASCSWELRAAV